MPSANAIEIGANVLDETVAPGSSLSGGISFNVGVTPVSSDATSTATVQPQPHKHKRVHGHL